MSWFGHNQKQNSPELDSVPANEKLIAYLRDLSYEKHPEYPKVKELLDGGADVNAVTMDELGVEGITPLIWVSQRKYPEIAKLLIERGANVDSKTSTRETPLHVATENNEYSIAQLLVTKGALVNEKNTKGETPLLIASRNKKGLGIVRLLLENGADINAADFHGWTPLMFASKEHNEDIIKFLAEHGASMNARNRKGETAAKIATNHSNKVVDFLHGTTGGYARMRRKHTTRKAKRSKKAKKAKRSTKSKSRRR
jgi:ankyrin repeat protein